MTVGNNDYYLDLHRRYLVSVCTGCLGWSAGEANEYVDRLTLGRRPTILNQKPGYWIADEFIPPAARALPLDRQVRLCGEIVEAIDPGDEYKVSHSAAECAALWERVRAVLRAYGWEGEQR